MSAPTVSIIIPVFNKWEYTAKCLRALADNTREIAHEVIVIDNASSDETARALPRVPGVRAVRNAENLGFARASNQGAALAGGRYLLFLNNDTEPHARWASAMVAEIERDPAIAIVGSKLLYPDGTIQHAGVAFAYAVWQPIMPVHLDSRRPATAVTARRELNAVTAACMLVRPDVFRAAGGFDEGYVNGYEDVDLCLTLRACGHKIVFTPESVVTHHESITEGRFDSSAANTERLMARWIERFDRHGFRFDNDFRRTARALAVAADRPGVTVVVVATRSIWTIAPCLENVWYTTGAQDEILIVDDSAGGSAGMFARQFAARHADRVRVLAAEHVGADGDGARVVGFPRAFRAGVAAATRPLCALLGPNVRVVGDWLGRLTGHLQRSRASAAPGTRPPGAVAATLGDATTLSTTELLAPTGQTDPSAAAGDGGARAGAAEALVTATVVDSFAVLARTEVWRAISETAPDALFGPDPTVLAAQLAARQVALARAADVVVYRLNQIAGGADPALRDHYLQRQARAAELAPDLDPGRPAVSVVIVAGGDPALAGRCLAAVRRATDVEFEAIVIANGADGEAARAFEDLSRRAEAPGAVTVVVNPRNEGFAYAANQGLDRARGRTLAVLHDDVVVGPGWIRRALALFAADPSIGAIGPATNEHPGTQRMRMVSYAGAAEAAAFAETWAAEHAGEVVQVPRLGGLCLILRREVVMRLGGFDTGFDGSPGLGKGADDDFTVRVARAGWRLAIALDVFVHHDGGATYRRFGLSDPRRATDAGWRAFCAKWEHPVNAKAPGDIARLGAVPFSIDRDRVPLRYDHIFCREAPPLALACRQPVRFLCFAADGDGDDAGAAGASAAAGWRGVVLRFVRGFTARDPVALVLRIEPPAAGAAERTLGKVAALLASQGIPLGGGGDSGGLPEVLFEATPLPPARRGSIYTAARALLLTGAAEDAVHAREAEACGLAVLAPGATAEELRSAVG